jgi:osmotically-inducible protein OsmY
MNPDMELRHEVFAALNWEPAIDACAVDVRVREGIVILRGNVADERQRVAAETAVRRVEGVRTLINRLTVKPAVPPVPDTTRTSDTDRTHVAAG